MIIEFKDEFSFLSNFFPCKIVARSGLVFPSSEHLFMSFKNGNEEWIKKCSNKTITPTQIKRLGRKVELVKDWESIKFFCMEFAVTQKFKQNKNLLNKLKRTGNQNLVEGNWWGDKIWGVCLKSNPNEGENHLGRILMKVREEL